MFYWFAFKGLAGLRDFGFLVWVFCVFNFDVVWFWCGLVCLIVFVMFSLWCCI